MKRLINKIQNEKFLLFKKKNECHLDFKYIINIKDYVDK
jgi:hypothetical protein